MASEFSVTGLAELQAQLDQLPAMVERKLLRGALRAGQKVVADYARDHAPVAEPSGKNAEKYGAYAGLLRDSIRVSARTRGGAITATVKAGNKKAYYAHWVEFGTLAHAIEAKAGGAISFGGREYKRLNHPGAKAHPFMRPALDWAANANGQPLSAVASYLQRRLTKELSSLPDQTDGPAPRSEAP